MIVTYNWLREFVEFDFTPEELSHRLTMAGLEVDAMEKIGHGLDSVIVARLASVDPHPEADRLTLCQVETGAEIVQIVCGATNHRTGDLVALAQVGTVLPGNFKIKKSKIRGRESMGMLCSEKELGLAAESEGIMILPPGLELGRPAFEALELKDVRYEIGLTPNRPDCLSILGVAREVSAMVGHPLRLPEAPMAESGKDIQQETSITVDEPGLCPRYAARLIHGVKIGPSPTWLVKKLESVGMRSINNVVDVTNFVLMELGHPLHAFDFNLLRGKRIVVRRANDREQFTSLDSREHELMSSDLTICDGEGPVALAGIMGGENSEVQPETTDIFLESAYFNPPTVRRTCKRLGIHTESSHRFERGADVNMVPVALDRAASLIQELAGGTVASGMIDVYPQALPERKLTITASRTSQVLGIAIDALEIQQMLRSIGLGADLAVDREDSAIYVKVPSFRPDLEREIDLIEEVARLNGYDRIPVTMPEGRSLCQLQPDHYALVKKVRNAMVEMGFSEVINYSFTTPSAWDRILLDSNDRRRSNVAIINPLTEEQSVMRTSLVPSLLETVSRNVAYRSLDLRLFELRPVFFPAEGAELPEEKWRLVVALCGRREPEGWAQVNGSADFFDLKGVVETLLDGFRVDGVLWDASVSEPFLHPGKSCSVVRGGARFGSLGEIHPKVLESYEIDQPVYIADLDLEQLFAAAKGHAGFKPISKFPEVYRDSALLLDEEVSAQEIFQILGRIKSKDLESVTLFDLYRGRGVPEGKKSMAIRARYRSIDKTLTDEEIQALHGKMVDTLCRQLKAEIR